MYQKDTKVLKINQLSEDVFRLKIQCAEISKVASPGQFIMVETCKSLHPLLRRPFSIHNVSKSKQTIEILFKRIGDGTKNLAALHTGDKLNIVGPLGKGFAINGTNKACLIGGGMGIAPLKFLAKKMTASNIKEIKVLLGARNEEEIAPLINDFIEMGITPEIATDDGSIGHHGFVIDLLSQLLNKTGEKWPVYCCGPHPMMKGIAMLCSEEQIACQVSMETMMACGIKACLGCTVEGTHTNIKGGKYLHVCQDGPVFDGGDIKW